MKLNDLVHLLKNAAVNGAEKALLESGVLNQYLTKAEAYRLYGRSDVDRWINEGLICLTTPNSKTIKKFIASKHLEVVAASSNRITYLPVVDRNG